MNDPIKEAYLEYLPLVSNHPDAAATLVLAQVIAELVEGVSVRGAPLEQNGPSSSSGN